MAFLAIATTVLLGLLLLRWILTLFRRTPSGEGKVACVTGAASGVGLATTKHFLTLGWTVIACDIDAAGLSKLKGTPRLHTCVVDTADEKSCAAAVTTVRSVCTDSASLDALVNVAGILKACPLMECSDEQLRRTLEVNVVGPLRLTRDLMELLLHGPSGGTVVNISSTGGRDSWPWTGAYAASKHALEGATDSVRREARANGLPLRVVLVEPGPVHTPMAAAHIGNAVAWTEEHSNSPWQPAMQQSAQKGLALLESDLVKYLFRSFFAYSSEQVAEVIVNAAGSSNPQPRYLCCKLPMMLLFYSVQMLPTSWGDAVMCRV